MEVQIACYHNISDKNVEVLILLVLDMLDGGRVENGDFENLRHIG